MDDKTKNGTLGELAVIKQLIQEDFEIYTSFNGKGSFDLVAYKPSTGIIKVEVKSTTQFNGSSYKVSLRRIRANTTECVQHKFDNNRQDILAAYIVPLDIVIFYLSKDIIVKSELSIPAKEIPSLCDITIDNLLEDSALGAKGT